MPSNKKKRGRAKKIAMKDKLAAAQAGGGASANNSNTTHLPSATVYPHQSPFAAPETPVKTLQRVLGYKFVCDVRSSTRL